jgi:phosphatidylglycerophosphate synthase
MIRPVPAWVGVYSVICIFLYQSLDAIDGKQARRTKSSSPLGQLFDHGCDGINTLIFHILLWQSFQRGADWGFFVVFVMFTNTFFLAQWEEQHTHWLRTSTMGVGVTERK